MLRRIAVAPPSRLTPAQLSALGKLGALFGWEAAISQRHQQALERQGRTMLADQHYQGLNPKDQEEVKNLLQFFHVQPQQGGAMLSLTPLPQTQAQPEQQEPAIPAKPVQQVAPLTQPHATPKPPAPIPQQAPAPTAPPPTV